MEKSLDQKVGRRSIEVQGSPYDQSFVLEEDQFSALILQDTRIPFLQMLHQREEEEEEDPSSVLSFKDPNFLELLSFQTLEKPWGLENYPEVPVFHSSIHSETNRYYHSPSLEGNNSSRELQLNPIGNVNPRRKRRNKSLPTSSMTIEKRKRKRTKPTKNIEEMENQRMTHIAVERNRRRQMNIHLNSLRSIIPSSYIQRGDQASIVGGAIDFVKILEQHLQSLEAQKIITQQTESKDNNNNNTLRRISSNTLRASDENQTTELEVFVTVTESHVNLKVQCLRKQGQLQKSIISLEKLGFTVLHLNITSPSNASVTYTFNLKMEDDCDLRLADEITTVVHQIFDC